MILSGEEIGIEWIDDDVITNSIPDFLAGQDHDIHSRSEIGKTDKRSTATRGSRQLQGRFWNCCVGMSSQSVRDQE